MNDEADFELATAVCADVSAVSDLVFVNVRLPCDAHHEQMVVSQSLRARLFFMGAVGLAKQKLVAPAAALIRCLMEQQYIIEAIAREPGYMRDLAVQDNMERRKALSRLLQLPAENRAANVVDDILREKLASTLDGLDGSRVHVSDWAARAGRSQEYELAYMLLSGAVHPSLRGAEAHLVLDETGNVVKLTVTPDIDQLAYLLMGACNSYLAILWAIPEHVRGAENIQSNRIALG